MPLHARAVLLTAAIVAALAPLGRAQSDAKPPAFEVASIKADNSGGRGSGGGTVPGGRFSVTNVTVQDLLVVAYNVTREQVTGGPNWLTTSHFDIIAKMPEGTFDSRTGTPSRAAAEPMLRTLLKDRFHLRVHHETRELTTVSLGLARADGKLGPGMAPASPADTDCSKPVSTDFDFSDPFKNVPPCRAQGGLSKSGGRRFVVRGMTMTDIAQAFFGQLGGRAPVRNDTGLAGAFNFNLEYAPDQGGGVDTSDLPSIFTAVQEQLGLKLVMKTVPTDAIVIDHVEKPTED